jgi:hypothetical protein
MATGLFRQCAAVSWLFRRRAQFARFEFMLQCKIICIGVRLGSGVIDTELWLFFGSMRSLIVR